MDESIARALSSSIMNLGADKQSAALAELQNNCSPAHHDELEYQAAGIPSVRSEKTQKNALHVLGSVREHHSTPVQA